MASVMVNAALTVSVGSSFLDYGYAVVSTVFLYRKQDSWLQICFG